MASYEEQGADPPPLSFSDLPDELVQMILPHVDGTDYSCLRCTTKRFRYLVDDFILRKFKKKLHFSSYSDPNGTQSVVLKTIKLATELYVERGLEPTFIKCLIPMLHSKQPDPFCPSIKKVTKFLARFYNAVAKMNEGPIFDCSHLLYYLTLIKLIKHFSRITIVSSTTISPFWRTIIEIDGPWFGKFFSTSSASKNPDDLLVILSQLLIADRTGKRFEHVWMCSDGIYALGNETTDNRKRHTKTEFVFTVRGSDSVLEFFRSCVEHCEVECPEIVPIFRINLDITCKGVPPWGHNAHRIRFGSFATAQLSDEGDWYDAGEEELSEVEVEDEEEEEEVEY